MATVKNWIKIDATVNPPRITGSFKLHPMPGAPDRDADDNPEITPEMIEIGIDVLSSFYPYFYEGIEHPDLIVRTVYEAMERVRIEQSKLRTKT